MTNRLLRAGITPLTRAARSRLVPTTLLVACALAAPAAQAAPASIQLRIEGRNSTIYEGPVTTDRKVVRPEPGEDHNCDGTNNGSPNQPGPTPITALDDARSIGGYTWAGTWFPSFEDYQVDRIGPDAVTDSEFWGQYVNSKASMVGGCQEIVRTGDEALWAFDAFSKAHVLKLAGPTSGTTGRPVSVRVTDGDTGAPLAGTSVGGSTTGADGRVALTFADEGIYRLKATRADSVRSNVLVLCVDPQGAAACTSTDRVAPKLEVLLARDTLATELGRSRTVLFSWQGEDPGGSGVTGYSVDVAELSGAGVNASADVFRPFVSRTPLTRASFRGDAGSSYRFRVTAFDRAINRASSESGVISIPVDDRGGPLKLKGWKRLRRKGAWGGTVIRSKGEGSVAKLRFRGRRVALIGRKLRRGGRVRVVVDGRSRVVSMRGKPRFRRVLFTSRRLRPGIHSVRVTTLSGSPVELDAVAPLP